MVQRIAILSCRPLSICLVFCAQAVLLQWDKCDARTKRLLTAVGAGTGKMKVFKLWVNGEQEGSISV